MNDSAAFPFAKLVPGFDFLQKLTSGGAGQGPMGGLGSWIAPTVSVEELDKRITELKAVLFWLEQNATALKATVQALEVQKMTLATLKGMNLSMAEVTKAFSLPTGEAASAAAPADAAAGQWPFGASPAAAPTVMPEPVPPPAPPAPEPPRKSAPRAKPARQAATGTAPAPAGGVADPMQWWGALTQQFQHIAASALREAARATPPTGLDTPSGAEAAAESAPAPAGARKKAGRQPAAKAARKPARKPAARPPAARKAPAAKAAPAAEPEGAAAKSPGGWPLPPPFKFGR